MRSSGQFGRVLRLRRQVILRRRPGTLVESGRTSAVDLTQMTPEVVGRVREYLPSDAAIDQMGRFLDEGRLGVLAQVEGRPAGHAWATVAVPTPVVVNGYFELAAGGALIHHCRVASEFRRRGVYGEMLDALCAILATHPLVSSVLLDAEASNRPSIKGAERADFVRCGYGIYLQVAGKTLLRRQVIDASEAER